MDYYKSLKEQSSYCRKRDIANVNFDTIAETLELLAERDFRAIKSKTSNLMAHLLKAKYQPRKSSKSWLRTITRELTEIPLYFEESPSLVNELKPCWDDCYKRAVTRAVRETGLNKNTFPKTCEWDFDTMFHKEEPMNDIIADLRKNIDKYEKHKDS